MCKWALCYKCTMNSNLVMSGILLRSARKAVEQAKKKVKQQQSVIRKLEQQRVNGGQDESISES